jgi:aminomethyltransferase
MCRQDGGIVDDLVVYRGGETWMVVVNAANRDTDMAWLREHAGGGTEIVDRSEELSLIALQGPAAEQMLPVEGVDLASLPYFGTARGSLAGVGLLLSRTGYTGEDGFELFVPSEHAGQTWALLVEAGAKPCGLAARDVCRLEAGLRLYGSDMDEQTNPYECGLGWTVKLGKGEFLGRTALQRVKAEGARRMLVGLGCAGRTIPRHGASVGREGRPIGVVTSGTYSFWLQKGIGMASVEAAVAEPGDQVVVEARGDGRAEVVALPFYRGSVKQAARA